MWFHVIQMPSLIPKLFFLASLLPAATLAADWQRASGQEPLLSDNSATTHPKPPLFPSNYHVKYTFSMPHFYLTQPNGLRYPVEVWHDGTNNRLRVESYDGRDTTLNVDGVEYSLYPRISEMDCDVYEPGPVLAEGGHTTRQGQHDALAFSSKAKASDAADGVGKKRRIPSMLPDLRDWQFGGAADVDGKEAQVWLSELKEGDKVSQYSFYVTPAGVPLKFVMFGINYLTDSHFDEYVYDFTLYEPDMAMDAKPGLFDVPDLCKGKPLSSRRHPLASQHEVLLPLPRSHDHSSAYHLWSRVHGRMHGSTEEFEERLEHFSRTADMVLAHNADSSQSFRMRLNLWADWSVEEFVQAMLPMRARKQQQQQHQEEEEPDRKAALKQRFKPRYTYRAKAKSRDELPRDVDWRGTGVDPGVKDQGMCGSCYAFAATGSMEGAWYVATGQRRSFSEQQVVDCAWDYGVSGCNGGDYEPVFAYVADNGGIALEQEYPYESEMGFCRSANHSLVGRFDGYIAIEARDELSLMEAVHKLGPVAVAVDAGPESFRYYSEGVYDVPHCKSKIRDLDHAVVLFGYGTSADGKDYWLVRNSWAKFYGDDGYIKIARGGHDCGISSDPTVASVPERYVVREAMHRVQLEAVEKW